MDSKLYDVFKKPGSEYRGKPFWSWNGALKKEELLRQVHVMKEMGFGGFFMHSRTGLATEYLGEEWFDLINTCADEAEKLGMEAWLYDEDRWPSGTAGGLVTKDPKYRMKFIYLTIVPANEFSWSEDITAAFACRLDGLNYYDCEQISRDTPAEKIKDKSILVFTIVEFGKSSFYNGYTYVDTMNREATEKFLELTHEQYKKHCGDRLGKSIKGIFTDEPHRGAVMDGFSVGNKRGEWHAPWTYSLFGDFKERFGYDLVPRLPELFLKPNGQSVSQVKWHYVELLEELFLENFAIPCNEWCEKNNMILTGHILHEDTLTSQTAMSGSMMRYYEHMGYPGIDLLCEHNYSFWVVKQLSSAARQVGKKWMLSELYGCTGWQMPFESHKAIGDWQALFGINLRCPHLSWYTMEGEAKRDYPASILHQSTWWKEYSHIENYFSRIGAVMTNGSAMCDVLVMNPVESVWCQIYPGWSLGLGPQSPEVRKLEESYRNMFHWLISSQIDFDYGDEEMVGRLYKVERNSDGTPVLRVGNAVYKVVIVGGMTTIRSSTLKILEEFIQAGGKVIFAGDTPEYVDALKSGEAAKLAQKAIAVPFEKEPVIKACKDVIGAYCEIIDASTGKRTEEIFFQLREDGVNKYLMMMNVNRQKAFDNVVVKIYDQGYVEEWNCVTGEKYLVGASDGKDYIEVDAGFPVIGEHLYVITKTKDPQLKNKPVYTEVKATALNGTFDFKLDEPNICVLDFARYKINDGEWQDEDEILKVDQIVRQRFDLNIRGGEMIQPWYAKKFEGSKFEAKGDVSLRFEFFIKDMPKGLLELVMERPENFEAKLNGNIVDTSKANGWWADACYARIPLNADYIVEGKNVVELKTKFHQGINLEAMYIFGNFGVELDGKKKTIVEMPVKLSIGSLVEQKLPFYSGKVTYKLNVPNKPSAGERVFISLENFAGSCVKVAANGKTPKVIAWQPYEADITEYLENSGEIELEYVLTRRNTFGPLHQVPLYAGAYGPDSFVTGGDSFTENYMLYPAGMVSAPKISIRK